MFSHVLLTLQLLRFTTRKKLYFSMFLCVSLLQRHASFKVANRGGICRTASKEKSLIKTFLGTYLLTHTKVCVFLSKCVWAQWNLSNH